MKKKIYNTIQNSGTVMHFLDQNLKIKSDEQLKHSNIMNEILWIYGMSHRPGGILYPPPPQPKIGKTKTKTPTNVYNVYL